MNLNERIAALEKAGWVRDPKRSEYTDEKHCWFHTNKEYCNYQKMGCVIEEAEKRTLRYNVLAAGHWWYDYFRLRRGSFNYGFVVKRYKGTDRKTVEKCFYCEDEKYIIKYLDLCNAQKHNLLHTLGEVPALTVKPYLLIAHGKHGDSYYHVPTIEAFLKAAKRIFEINKDNCFYTYLEEEARDRRIPKPSMTIEESKAHDAEIQEFIKKRWEEYNRLITYTDEEKKERELYARVIEGNDDALIEFIIDRGREAQYEKLSYETFDSLEDEE